MSEGDFSESASAGQSSLAAGQTVTALQTAAGGNISLMSRHTGHCLIDLQFNSGNLIS